jgi:hypothetical protein
MRTLLSIGPLGRGRAGRGRRERLPSRDPDAFEHVGRGEVALPIVARDRV